MISVNSTNKPDDYSILKDIKNYIQDYLRVYPGKMDPTVKNAVDNILKFIDTSIPERPVTQIEYTNTLDQLLINLGFDITHNGTKYIMESVALINSGYQDARLFSPNGVYHKVAAKYGVSKNAIERGVRYSVKTAYQKSHAISIILNNFCKFSRDEKSPSSKQFLFGIWRYCVKCNVKIGE